MKRPPPNAPPRSLGLPLALALVFLSGAAGLGYQMTWNRLFSAGLGHEVPAMVSVIAAFLGGMALGAAAIDRLLARWRNAATAASCLAMAEWVIGAWGLVSAWLIPAMNHLALDWLGPQPSAAWHWSVVFALPFATLLPSTLAMGATLPIMVRCFQPLWPDGGCVGALYFANTLGAMVGTLGSTFLLMPAVGLRGSLIALAAINAAVALVIGKLPIPEKPTPRGRPLTPGSPGASGGSLGDALGIKRWSATAFAGGFLAIGFELVGVRGLTQVMENTAYTYAAILAVYLGGTALGGAWFQRVLRDRPPRRVVNGLLAGLSASAMLAGWALRQAPVLHPMARNVFGDSLAGVLVAEVGVAGIVFGLPTVLMGALFSLTVQSSVRLRGSAGRAVMWNTLGCCVAAGVVSLWLLPAAGVRGALLAIAAGYVPWLVPNGRKGWWLPAVLLGLLGLFPSDLHLIQLPPGATVIGRREGVLATATVIRSADGHRTLRVNNRLQMGGTSSTNAQQREAHLPLLLHPAPRTALFLGPGTGITLGAAAAHPGLRVTAVELLPEVLELMPHFQPENRGPFTEPEVTLRVADARRFVRTDSHHYDVVVADLFHPAQDGAGFLYTREHFEAIRQRLTEGGLFCQWLPLHQLDPPTLRIIVRTFIDVFSEAQAFLLHFNADIPVLGLIGGRGRPDLDPGRLEQRLSAPELRAFLRGVGLDKTINLLGCFAGGPRALRGFTRDAGVATDLNPTVLFRAPRHSVRRDAPASATLLAWLQAVSEDELLEAPGWRQRPEFGREVLAFIHARDIYLRGLVRESQSDLNGAIDLYLESSAQSLYFTPAYARVVTVVQVMAQADRARAQALWQRLEQARPDQPLGRRLLAPLFDGPSVAPPDEKE